MIKEIREDGWKNLVAGLGRLFKSDKTESTGWEGYDLLDDKYLSNIYDGEGLASKIIDIVPDDMTRAGWEITNDDDGLISKELKRLKANKHINTALKYARLYRGAIIIMVPRSGLLEKPMTETPSEIRQLRVYSAARIEMTSIDIIEDPKSPYFEDVEIFKVRKRDGLPMHVHQSRCLVFKGETGSDSEELDLRYRYWGFSTIQKIWARLKNYSAVEKGIANLMLEFSVAKIKLSDLAQILSQGEAGVTKAYERLEIINASKSIINAVILGENEDYTRENIPLAGVGEVVDRMMMNLAAVSNIPVTKLFGRSAVGMNATGEGDLRDYYDDVASDQEVLMGPELEKLVNRVASYTYPGNRENKEGELIEEYPIEFNSLWEATEKEKAEVNKLNAETDNLNITNQIIGSDEARVIRYPDLEQNPSFSPVDDEEE